MVKTVKMCAKVAENWFRIDRYDKSSFCTNDMKIKKYIYYFSFSAAYQNFKNVTNVPAL